MPGQAALGPAGPTGPDRTSPCGRAGPAAPAAPAAPGRAAPGSHRRPAGRRNATGGKASAHTRPDRAGLRHATGARPGFATRPAARLRRAHTHTHTTGPGFGTPPAQLIPRSWTDRTLSSLSSISPTITLLRSPNASSPRLASGSLLLPPFTRRSLRNSVEKNADRHLRFPN